MHRSIKYFAATAVVVLGLAGAWPITHAQTGGGAGSLDPTFGTNGLATTTVPNGSIARWIATQDVPLSDGTSEEMIVAVGTGWTIARHRANGAIDTTFKNDPKARTGGAFTETFTYGAGTTLYGGLVVQPDKKIVVAGRAPVSKRSSDGTRQWAMAVARYEANGRDDATFGSNGLVMLTEPGYSSPEVFGVALQPDGKIIVVGGCYFTYCDHLVAIRLQSNGGLDSSFGAGGVFRYSYPTGWAITPRGVALQTVLNGSGQWETRAVIVGGTAVGVGTHHNVAFLLRLTKDARLDAIGNGLDVTFGSGGVVQSEVPGADETHYCDIGIDSRNRVVVGGNATVGLNDGPPTLDDMVVARFLEDGTPDLTFNGSGMFTQGDASHLYGIAVQPDDKILAAGWTGSGLAAVWRLGTDGLLDSSFGSGGLVTTAGSFWDVMLVHKPVGPVAFVTGGRAPAKGGNTAGLWALWRYLY